MTIQEVDERIDMKLGVLIEIIDDKFARFLEVIQSQTDQIIATQKNHDNKFDQLDRGLSSVQTDTEIVKVQLHKTSADVQDLKQHMTQVEKAIAQKI